MPRRNAKVTLRCRLSWSCDARRQEGTRWLAGEPLKHPPFSPSARILRCVARQDTEQQVTYQQNDSDIEDFDDDLDEQQDDTSSRVSLDRKQIRSMERDAKQSRKNAEENVKLQRELAFTKAGIDTDADPRLTYFAKGYDGEMTAAAIRAAAEAAGFLTPAETDTSDEMAALDRVSQASSGSTPRSSDESNRTSMLQAGTVSREAVLAEIERIGGIVLR